MWFRVEFNKDGSVKGATAVEARGTDAGLVCYMDADNTGAATQSAIEWRKRYLEAARRNSARQRENAKSAGMCPECGHRKPLAGKQRCEFCLDKHRRRNAEPHVVRVSGDVPTPEQVQKEIRKRFGVDKVGIGVIAQALDGSPISAHSATRVANAVRATGAQASAERISPRPRGGGRHLVAETELEVLLAAQTEYRRRSWSGFGRWLRDQIEERRRRIAGDSLGASAAE